MNVYVAFFKHEQKKYNEKEDNHHFYVFNSIIKGSTRLLAVVTRVFVASVPHRDTHTLVLTTYMEKKEMREKKGSRKRRDRCLFSSTFRAVPVILVLYIMMTTSTRMRYNTMPSILQH